VTRLGAVGIEECTRGTHIGRIVKLPDGPRNDRTGVLPTGPERASVLPAKQRQVTVSCHSGVVRPKAAVAQDRR